MARPEIRPFWFDGQGNRQGAELSNSWEAYNVLKPLLAEEDDVEKVYVIFLDSQNRILKIEKVFSGSLTAATIYPRELIKRLLQHKASAFLMAHNHPSGDTNPSAEDRSITLKLGIAAASIDVAFHDHIIIGDGYYSMADAGRLQQISSELSKLLSAA